MLGGAFDLVGNLDAGSATNAGVGIVVIHGFTGTSFEIRYLAEQLAGAGFFVQAPLLPGHGTSLDELDGTNYGDWTRHIDEAIAAMAAQGRRVALVGQSLGGLLALEAASRHPEVVAVAALATPIWLGRVSGVVARLAAAGRLPFHRLPKLGGSDLRDRRARAANPCYPAMPVRALGQLLEFMHIADEALPRITQPVLVLHGRHDHTAPVACASYIARRTNARRVRILPRSYHLIAADVERDLVASEVINFLRSFAHPIGGAPACVT